VELPPASPPVAKEKSLVKSQDHHISGRLKRLIHSHRFSAGQMATDASAILPGSKLGKPIRLFGLFVDSRWHSIKMISQALQPKNTARTG
jgi:hypothetical protein